MITSFGESHHHQYYVVRLETGLKRRKFFPVNQWLPNWLEDGWRIDLDGCCEKGYKTETTDDGNFLFSETWRSDEGSDDNWNEVWKMIFSFFFSFTHQLTLSTITLSKELVFRKMMHFWYVSMSHVPLTYCYFSQLLLTRRTRGRRGKIIEREREMEWNFKFV